MFVLVFCTFLVRVLSIGDEFKPSGYLKSRPGPWVSQTYGEVWPKPQYQELSSTDFRIDRINFVVNHGWCKTEVLNEAASRYRRRIFDILRRNSKSSRRTSFQNSRFLNNTVLLNLINGPQRDKDCFLTPEMNEEYEVDINKYGNGILSSQSIWGILRGLETFTQMIYVRNDQVYVNATYVRDFPRFPYRALMIDTARHFMSKRVLLENLDLMEMNKMNVFHWHMTDSESFPFRSERFPNMSLYGAFHPETHVYTVEDVKDILIAARLRGIRVIPEFDIPGHTQSWGKGMPDLLTTCYENSGLPSKSKGPINPVLSSTYIFLQELFKEILDIFYDDYLMIGGDEVGLECWRRSPEINEVLNSWSASGQYRQLEYFFIARMIDILKGMRPNIDLIVWEEVFTNGYLDRIQTIINVWKDWGRGWKRILEDATSEGYRVILTAPWYLNYLDYGSDWIKRYEVEPQDFYGNETQKALLLGGGACLWSEYITSSNLISRVWPRASAVAERLWSSQEVKDIYSASKRLQEQECRMLARGYSVGSANGAGFCPGVSEL